MRSLAVWLMLLASALAVSASGLSSQAFVAVGDAEIAAALAANPSLEAPVLIETEHHDSLSEVENEILHPSLLAESAHIREDQAELARLELLAHEVGAPVLAETQAEKEEREVSGVEHSLISQSSESEDAAEAELEAETESSAETEADSTVDEPLPTALLQQAPVAEEKHAPANEAEADAEEMERELNMVELESSVAGKPVDAAHDYAFLDDPKFGGQPTELKNLRGIDIYVVNTPVNENDNEIRPVKPPHPMSASMREKARLAALMRKQLVHDVPLPKAAIAPKTRINTLSAYESSLTDSRPLRKLSRAASRDLAQPIVGGIGAMQLRSVSNRAPRFAQLGMEDALPGTPYAKDPNAAPEPVRAYGSGASFDVRDGPPALLDDLLPIKATMVEDLDPLGLKEEEAKPNW